MQKIRETTPLWLHSTQTTKNKQKTKNTQTQTRGEELNDTFVTTLGNNIITCYVLSALQTKDCSCNLAVVMQPCATQWPCNALQLHV